MAPFLPVHRFFEQLNARGVRYVVLRWFETLPRVESGEDIDLLIEDEDLPKLEGLLVARRRWGQKVDLYTVGGLPGTDFRGLPYFPEQAARQILTTAVWNGKAILVPAAREHFLSMAFHCLYHKGFASGLAARPDGPTESHDHNYPALLPGLAAEAGVSVASFDMDTLDTLLESLDWRPRADSLEKWSARNRWIRESLEKRQAPVDPIWHGLIVFLIREEGVPSLNGIRDLLWEEGLALVADSTLEGERKERATKGIRGGNWGKGPYKKSGGLPSYVLITYDVFPQEPDEALKKAHPGITNARIEIIKRKVRELGNHERGEETCNIVHSSDNAWQALEYLLLTTPELEGAIRRQCEALTKQFMTPHPVLRNLSGNSRRAKVELIDFNGTEAICKTFRPDREEFLQRELRAREIPGAEDLVAPILELGSLHMVVKKYQSRASSRMSLFPLGLKNRFLAPSLVGKPRELLLAFRKYGYELLDFKMSNWLFDSDGNMRFTDLEFLTYTGQAEDHLKGCLAWYPLPSTFTGRKPKNRKLWKNPYGISWLSFLGLPRFLAIHDIPVPVVAVVQVLTAPVVVASKVSQVLGRRLSQWVAKAKSIVRRMLR